MSGASNEVRSRTTRGTFKVYAKGANARQDETTERRAADREGSSDRFHVRGGRDGVSRDRGVVFAGERGADGWELHGVDAAADAPGRRKGRENHGVVLYKDGSEYQLLNFGNRSRCKIKCSLNQIGRAHV